MTTFRMATKEETQALFGNGRIFFGVKPPASYLAKLAAKKAAEAPPEVIQEYPNGVAPEEKGRKGSCGSLRIDIATRTVGRHGA